MLCFPPVWKGFQNEKISKCKISKCLKCKQVCARARWFKMKNKQTQIQWSLLIQIKSKCYMGGKKVKKKGEWRKIDSLKLCKAGVFWGRWVESSVLILRSRSSTRYTWSSVALRVGSSTMTQIMHHSAYSVNVFVHLLKSLYQLLQRRLWMGWSVIRRKMCSWGQNFVDQLNRKVMLL